MFFGFWGGGGGSTTGSTFSTLYGDDLDRELGSADRTQLFTTARRKAAINAGQVEWIKRTECMTRETTIAIVDTTQEYDIEATVTDYAWISKQGVSIKIVSGTNTRYIEGDDLEVTTVERLNQEEPGWRAVPAGTPRKVYTRRNGGAVNLGLHPAPSVTSGDVWTLIVPYVVVPDDMVNDTDAPFSISSNPVLSMRPWYRALVYFAAFDLEKFRKDQARGASALQLFEAEVAKYFGATKPKGGQGVRMIRNYRGSSVVRMADPRT
jgi:hypothetical protein